jgi:hypothetical protein
VPGQQGECANGTLNCVSGSLQCQQTTFPVAEVCDALDNNCDGNVDEGVCGPILTNGSFETGDFTGWTTQDLSSPFWPLTVDGAGVNPGFGFFSSSPTDGSWAALLGFDGDGPGTIEIGQDATIPAVAQATLHFDYRGGWDLFTFGAILDRTFSVQIEPPGGGPPLFTQLILTAQAGTNVSDTGPLNGTVDLSPWVGQQIHINFVWWVPENFSGPAFFQLDNVYITLP